MTIKLKGTTLEISFYFAAAITLLMLFDPHGKAVLWLAAAVIHEVGHLLCLISWGDIPRRIVLLPFGMRIERLGNVALSFREEAVTAFAGPLINLVIASFFAIAYKISGNHSFYIPFALNLGLAIFNLLPIEPLDGGRILHAILSQKLPKTQGDFALTIISAGFLMPLAALGFYVLIKSRYNFTLLAVTIYLTLLLLFKK